MVKRYDLRTNSGLSKQYDEDKRIVYSDGNDKNHRKTVRLICNYPLNLYKKFQKYGKLSMENLEKSGGPPTLQTKVLDEINYMFIKEFGKVKKNKKEIIITASSPKFVLLLGHAMQNYGRHH